MAENVSTGGIMQFRHEGEMGKLDDERRALIEQGYREAEERKQQEQKRKRLLWLALLLLVILGIALYLTLRYG